MIVLNEHAWAEEMIASRSLGKKPFETMTRVARYYIDNGIPKQETRKLLDSFLIQCDPTASVPKWSATLDRALAVSLKYPAVDIKSIPVTEAEMRTIEGVEGRQAQRLAFALLCLSKYWDAITSGSGHWVNNKDSEIMHLANINTSIRRQGQMYHALNESGLIQFSRKVDNTNVRVCFVSDGTPVLQVHDFRNLGYQYMKYHGEPYFECCNCGITTKLDHTYPEHRGQKQKYCKSCAAKIRMQQNINSVMRLRGCSAGPAT